MASIGILKKIAKISKYTGFTALCYFLNRNRKRTIAYHNVIPDKYWDNSVHLAHSMKESSFRKQIEIIKDRFDIDLDIENSKTITLTFDDGYLNQCSIASKILDEHGVNGYFFCVADLINYDKTLDMDMLQYWISYVPFGIYEISEINLSLVINYDEDRAVEWQKISDKLNEGVTSKAMKKYLEQCYLFSEIKSIDNIAYNLRFSGIDYKNLDLMKEKGHKIGAHSARHMRLSKLNDNELKEDINICKENLGKLYNTDIFCYPYGSIEDISEKVIELISINGFTKAFAYSNSPLKYYGYNKYFIPRMFIPDTDDKYLIDFILSGAKHFISFRELLPNF